MWFSIKISVKWGKRACLIWNSTYWHGVFIHRVYGRIRKEQVYCNVNCVNILLLLWFFLKTNKGEICFFIIGTLQVVWNDSGSYHVHILLNVLCVGHSLPTCQLWKHPLYFSLNFLCSEAILPIAHVFFVFLRIISKSTSMFLSLYLPIISWLLMIPKHLIKF